VRAADRVVCTAQVAVEERLSAYSTCHGRDARAIGYATLACASLLSWAWQHGACIAYLQVTADNAPAIAAYRKFGFATAYTYHYRCGKGVRVSEPAEGQARNARRLTIERGRHARRDISRARWRPQ
jgi:hypothetical protein